MGAEIVVPEVIDAEVVVTIEDAARHHDLDPDVMRQFVMDGDLSKISPRERPALVMALCRHIGVDPIERPFLVFRDGKREILYAARSCTSALCRQRKISRQVIGVEEKTIAGQDMIVAKARATMLSSGRHDESTGVVPVLQRDAVWENGRKVTKGWRMPDPEEAANLVMKAETKAKRRAVLDLVGLGITDESELDTMPSARPASVNMATGQTELEPDPTQPIPAADPLGPRCTGENQHIADALAHAIEALAEMAPTSPAKAWWVGLKRSGIDQAKYGATPRKPVELTKADGALVLAWFGGKLSELEERAQGDSAAPTDHPSDDGAARPESGQVSA